MPVRRLPALVVLAAVLAACGGSGYAYVANRREGVFFKVPDEWRVFETDELLDAEAAAGRWVRGFDAAAVPDPDRVFVVQSTTPRGFAEVRALSASERQRVSLTTLRATGFGATEEGEPIDPLLYAEQNPDELRILDYEELVLDDARGVRLRIRATDRDGTVVILDQRVLVDDATSTRFLFTIGCTDECWEAHGDQMEEVLESWTLQAS